MMWSHLVTVEIQKQGSNVQNSYLHAALACIALGWLDYCRWASEMPGVAMKAVCWHMLCIRAWCRSWSFFFFFFLWSSDNHLISNPRQTELRLQNQPTKANKLNVAKNKKKSFSFVCLFRISVTLAIIHEICQISWIWKYSRMEESLH